MNFKKHFLIFVLSITSILAFGQKANKWQLSFQLQPEFTFHKNDYAFRWKEKYTKSTFNVGLSSSLHYNLTDKLFVEGGLGFISRRLKTTVFVDQSLLPPPYFDTVAFAYLTKRVSFTTLQFPLSLGFNFFRKKNIDLFVKGTYINNFLLEAEYEVNNYPSFKKKYWQGYSINAGIGVDYHLNTKIILTNTLLYSIKNTIRKDDYLYSQDEHKIALTHTFLQLSTGIIINI